MEMQTIRVTDTMRDLVRAAHQTSDPVIVFDGPDECLVAMRPAVFERILFDGEHLHAEGHSAMHLSVDGARMQ